MLLFLLLIVSARASGDIVELTDENIKSVLQNNEWVIVKLYATWCGHCQKLAPEFAKAAVQFEGMGVVTGEMNCPENEDSCELLKIQGYPTIILFNRGKQTLYTGPRDAASMVSFVKKAVGLALTHITSSDQLAGMTESFIIAFLPDAESADFQEFKNASMLGNTQFLYVTDRSLLANLSTESYVLYYRNTDQKVIAFTGEVTSEGVAKFIDLHIIPGVVRLDSENSAHLFKEHNRVLVVVMDFSADNLEEVESFMLEAYEAAGGKVKTCLVDSANADFKPLIDYFGFAEGPFFGGILIDRKPILFRAPSHSLEKANLVDFAVKWADDQLERYMRKEPLPEDWDQLPVAILTGENLEEVINSGKMVFVVFYAPWCQHCKNLMPILDKVALHFEDNQDMMFAKLDATKNDVDYDFEGFPTLFLFHQGQKRDYEGHRTFDAIVAFMDKAASELAPQPSPEEL